MKISIISADELDTSLIERWKQIQTSDEALRSPYYRPEFTQLVSRTGRAVRVLIMEDGGAVQGFFPYEKDKWGRLMPVGGALNAYHGLIATPGLDLDALSLMKSCGSNYFGFNHLPLTQTVLAPFIRFHNVSPILELQGGWDAYVQRLANIQNTKSPGILGAIKKSSKRLERDLGPLRFEMHERNPRVLDELMRLKSEQWIRTMGAGEDAFAIAWVRQLMIDTHATQTADFSGFLCALYAGEKLISIYFGMRTGTTLHSWFLVYDLEQAYYQPGLILLKNIAESACQEGLNVIDLGRGTQDYKMRFNTQVVALGEGVVSRPAILAQSIIAAKKLKAQIKVNPKIIQLRKWMSNRKK